MSDHWHYSSDIHGGADQHHRHYDLESDASGLRSLIEGLREDLGRAEERIRELEDTVREHQMAVPHALEDRQPDPAEITWRGDDWTGRPRDPEDPGPEPHDEGEYRGWLP